MTILEPDHLNILWRFTYRQCKVEIDQRTLDERYIYVAWVHYAQGCAIATSNAPSKANAIRQAKAWIDQKLASSS